MANVPLGYGLRVSAPIKIKEKFFMMRPSSSISV
jgi:hypothetical protein